MTDLQELYSAADLDILKNYVKKHYGKVSRFTVTIPPPAFIWI